MVYGLDSCKSVNTFEIPNDLANNNGSNYANCRTPVDFGANWDVIVLTHVPLFDSNTPQFQPYTCWAGNTVQNADTLLQILKLIILILATLIEIRHTITAIKLAM